MAERLDEPGGAEQNVVPYDHISLYVMMQKCNKPIIARSMEWLLVWTRSCLACDIRIASDQARFAEVFVRRGMIPASGGTYFLPRLVGIDRALLMAWTGDMLDAKEAEQIGLVTMVVPHNELELATMEIAEKLAKGRRLQFSAPNVRYMTD